jgi:hypothetical protein
MWTQLKDYYFWFSQPSSFLSPEDKIFFYVFLAMVVIGVIFRVMARFTTNQITRKIWIKFWQLLFWIGISGLIWFGMRYENTFIFARRYWAGFTFVIGIIWLFFILKYLIFSYRGQKKEYEKELLKNKYLPRG